MNSQRHIQTPRHTKEEAKDEMSGETHCDVSGMPSQSEVTRSQIHHAVAMVVVLVHAGMDGWMNVWTNVKKMDG